MIEREIDVETEDGSMKTFVFHPEEGGPFPVILYLMDAPSIRPALIDMASRLASAGYYVMLPYLYYRASPYREFGESDEDMHVRRGLMESITKAGAVSDARALLAYADEDRAVALLGRAGVIGFCMSGPLALAVANALPERIAAAASIHGAWFVTDRPDSAHLNLSRIKAELYFAWCANDATAPISDMETLESALKETGVLYRMDFFENAQHGFAPAGVRYDRVASEKHWERVHALMRRALE